MRNCCTRVLLTWPDIPPTGCCFRRIEPKYRAISSRGFVRASGRSRLGSTRSSRDLREFVVGRPSRAIPVPVPLTVEHVQVLVDATPVEIRVLLA